jgi:hypothetical protein
VTHISDDGTMLRRSVDTAQLSDHSDWEELAARALAMPLPYRPVPGIPVIHVKLDDRMIMVAQHDLAGPLLDLVTAVLALGGEV